MTNDQNNIDVFYRNTLYGHKEVLGGKVWGRMKWRLLWFEFRKYLIGFAALILLGSVTYFVFFANNQTSANHAVDIVVDKTSPTLFEHASSPTKNNTQKVSPKIESIVASNPNPTSTTLSITSGVLENTSVANTVNFSSDKASDEAKRLIIEEQKNINFNTVELLELKTILSHNFLDSDESPVDELIIDSVSSPYFDIRKTVRFAISFYAAPAYSTSSLSASNAYDDYLAYRNDHESGTFSWSAGANFQVNIKNWHIQTGLNYSTYSDGRNYNHSFQEFDSINSYFNNDTIWGWVYDPPDYGKPIVLSIDSSFVPVYNDINEGINTWKYFEIPLLVGYSFHANRFSFDISTGFSYGFFLDVSGNVPDLTEENLFTELSDIENQMNKHQFNYILQLGLSYHITPQWSLLMKPYYKQNLQSVFISSYPIDQRFKSFGIQLGLKVDL